MPRAISITATRADNKPLIEFWDTFGQFEPRPSMTALNYPPHITLAIYDDLDVEVAAAALGKVAAEQNSLKLVFEQLDYFRLPRFVVWARPNEDETLLKLHQKLHSLIDPRDCHEHYRPGTWIPHCSVATDIPLERVGAALAQQAEPFEPFEVVFNSIDYLEFPPVRVLHSVAL